jgi:hypothetical protein
MGSRRNKFTFLGVEAPAWQGAEAQEYRDISAPNLTFGATPPGRMHRRIKM